MDLFSYKLVDFGLAEKVNDLQSRYGVNRQPLTDSSGRLNKSLQSSIEASQGLAPKLPTESNFYSVSINY